MSYINLWLREGRRTPSEHAMSDVAPLVHNSSFTSCQGSGYLTPDEHSSATSGTSSPARASILSSSGGSVESVDSADAAVIIEPEINVMPCDEITDYVDVQSVSEEETTVAMPKKDLSCQSKECVFKSPEPSKPTTPSTDALSTLLTEGFLEPKRISLGLAPPELSPPVGMQCLAPPLAAYATAMASSAASSVLSTNLTPNLRREHRRQSSTNAAVSWNETVSIKRSPMKKQMVKSGKCGMQTVHIVLLSLKC